MAKRTGRRHSRRPCNKRENVDRQRCRGMPLCSDHSVLWSGSIVSLCSGAQLSIQETSGPNLQKRTSADKPPLYFRICTGNDPMGLSAQIYTTDSENSEDSLLGLSGQTSATTSKNTSNSLIGKSTQICTTITKKLRSKSSGPSLQITATENSGKSPTDQSVQFCTTVTKSFGNSLISRAKLSWNHGSGRKCS